MAGPRPPACRPPLSLLLLLLLLQASPSGGLSLRAAARRPLAASAAVVQPDYGVYLRAAPLLAAVRDLVAANPGTMRADTLRAELAGYAAEVEVVTVDLTGGAVPPAQQLRVWLNYGEHGRELVSSEAALGVLRLLAQGAEAAAAAAASGLGGAGGGTIVGSAAAHLAALRRTVFKVVPLENAAGRAAVEKGEICLRKNGRGVDPNRNWDVHWGVKEKDYDPYEEAPGAHPFSEPEAALLRAALAAWQPHAWVNVHSGMRAMFMPFDHVAATPAGAPGAAHAAILAALKSAHCPDCETGSGGATVGYLAHGTATDYAFLNLSVPVAMTWEIYGDLDAERADCFRMFNPLGAEQRDRLVAAWAAAAAALPALLSHHPDVPFPPQPPAAAGGGAARGGGAGAAAERLAAAAAAAARRVGPGRGGGGRAWLLGGRETDGGGGDGTSRWAAAAARPAAGGSAADGWLAAGAGLAAAGGTLAGALRRLRRRRRIVVAVGGGGGGDYEAGVAAGGASPGLMRRAVSD